MDYQCCRTYFITKDYPHGCSRCSPCQFAGVVVLQARQFCGCSTNSVKTVNAQNKQQWIMHTEYLHCHCAVLQLALQSDVYQLHQSPAVTDNTVPCSTHLHWYAVGMQMGQLSPNASELTPEFPVNPMRKVNAVRQGGVVISYVQKNHWRRLLNTICWHSRTNIPLLTSQMQDEWICSINIHCVHEKNGPLSMFKNLQN